MEVREKINCSGIDHTQLYAQLKAELLNGERYWFTSEEEKEIQANNRAFYKQSPVQEIFHKCFRLPADEKEGRLMTAAEIFCRLQKKFPAALRTSNASQMGKTLQALGVQRTHTRQGNAYLVVRCETVKGAFRSSFHRFKMIINMLMSGDGSECSRWKYIEESDFGRKYKSIYNIQKKSLLLHP